MNKELRSWSWQNCVGGEPVSTEFQASKDRPQGDFIAGLDGKSSKNNTPAAFSTNSTNLELV